MAAELRRLHTLMTDWPARPDFPGTRELLTTTRSGDVDLTAMPAPAVAACRSAWQALTGQTTVIHGDPCAANVRVLDGQVGFLDWAEARVDHPVAGPGRHPGHDGANGGVGDDQCVGGGERVATGAVLRPTQARTRPCGQLCG